MTMNQWVEENLGKGIDYDNVFGVQCVDLIKSFVKNVLGVIPQSIGNAIEYYNKRNTSSYLKKNFKWIDYKKNFVPAKGDICVFTTKSGKGHVSIATGKGNAKYFYSYDQNYPRGQNEPMTEIKHNYNSLLGVLRPYNQNNIKSNMPTVATGKKYTFTTRPYCYKDTSKKSVYTVGELTKFSAEVKARLKKGTTVKAQSVKYLNNDVWITYKYNSKTVWALVYSYKKNKSYIK